ISFVSTHVSGFCELKNLQEDGKVFQEDL
ncbi:hypothetical protein A2U01_0066456, partial [Trifolium medium]|nr:hypothetical protein [Trifolium medium]